MNILVIATTLQAGGGITIYKQFLSHLLENIAQNNYWIFINPFLPKVPIMGVRYISFPLQSKIKRTLFEGKLLKEEILKLGITPDIIISLQNNGYKCFNSCKQIVYFHQSIPLYPGLYNPFNSSERTLFNYKFIFPIIVKRTWTRNTKFVVQTSVVKKRFVSYFKIPANNVHVCTPDIEKIKIDKYRAFNWHDNKYHLIFVGDDSKYRNGRMLIKAMYFLSKENPSIAKKIIIHVTSSPKEAPHMYKLAIKYNILNNFLFEGILKHDTLLSYYKSAIALLFPSSIETVGLPLLEAAATGLSIIVADTDYAHNVMRNYSGAKYIAAYDYKTWGKSIAQACINIKRHKPLSQNKESDWVYFFSLVNDYQ